jgi:hypothetical protein
VLYFIASPPSSLNLSTQHKVFNPLSKGHAKEGLRVLHIGVPTKTADFLDGLISFMSCLDFDPSLTLSQFADGDLLSESEILVSSDRPRDMRMAEEVPCQPR